jgi:hypothetical protein
MSRPTRPTVDAGDASWDAPVNDANIQLYDRPAPIGELHAGTLSSLGSARAPSAYDQCLAWAWFGASGGSGFVPVLSNGSAWVPVSNWIAARKKITSVSSAYPVVTADDVIVTTGASSFAVTLPAADASNEGREIEVKHNGTGTVTLTPDGSDTIDGGASLAMASQYNSAIVRSDGAGNWLLLTTATGGVSTFLGLTDVPSSYSGQGLLAVRVNAGETGLEFAAGGSQIIPLIVAVSDETTDLTTGTAKVTFRVPAAFTVTGVKASLTTTSSSGDVVVDINEGGTSILSAEITVDQGDKTSVGGSQPGTVSDASLAADAEITIDIDSAGTGAKGLKVTILGTM